MSSEDSKSHNASRSRADDILDAVQGVEKPKKTTGCPQCGNTKLVRRGSSVAGGTSYMKCLSCKLEIPLSTTGSPVVETRQERVHPGPFYSGSPTPKLDKDQPIHRQVADMKSRK